jgi:hypothetical protein
MIDQEGETNALPFIEVKGFSHRHGEVRDAGANCACYMIDHFILDICPIRSLVFTR